MRECKQLSAVLNQHAFQADQLAAIHLHLQSTHPVSDEKPIQRQAKMQGRKSVKKKMLHLEFKP